MASATSTGKGDSKKPENVKSESPRNKYKSILQRTGRFQNYFHELWQLISNYTVKTACLRDKSDDIAKCLNKFSKVEDISTSSKLAMVVSAELLASVGDYEDLEVQRMETLVLPNLSSYGMICDSVKADIFKAMNSIKKENERKQLMNNIKKKGAHHTDPKIKQVLDEAIREYERACAESARLCQLSQEHVIKFEHKRLMDMKETLGNFVKIQIATHAKALELLSQTYKHIQSIDEDADLDILKASLQINDDRIKKKALPPKRTDSKRSRGKVEEPKRSSSSKMKVVKSNKNLSEDEDNSSSSKSEDSDEDDDEDATFTEEIHRLENALNSNHKKSRFRNAEREHSHEKPEKVVGRSHSSNSNKECIEKVKVPEKVRSKSLDSKGRKGEERERAPSTSRQLKQDDSRGKVRTLEDHNSRAGDGDYYTALKMANNRPTSPPRPLRFSPKLNEDNIEFNYRSKSPSSAQSAKNAFEKGQKGAHQNQYYYSESEDEDMIPTTSRQPQRQQQLYSPASHQTHYLYNASYSYQRDNTGSNTSLRHAAHPATPPTNGRRVSFQQTNSNQQHYFNDNPNPSRSDPQMLYSPVKSSLKRYC